MWLLDNFWRIFGNLWKDFKKCIYYQYNNRVMSSWYGISVFLISLLLAVFTCEFFLVYSCPCIILSLLNYYIIYTPRFAVMYNLTTLGSVQPYHLTLLFDFGQQGSRVVYNSWQLGKFAGFSARFLLSLLLMSQDMLRRRCLSGPITVYFSQNSGYLKP